MFRNIELSVSVFVLLTLSGCAASILPRSMGTEPLEKKPFAYRARPCALYVEQAIDARTDIEKLGVSQSRYLLLVPLVPLMWLQETEEQIYQDPKSTRGADFAGQVTLGLKKTIEASRVCTVVEDRNIATFVLQPTIERAYAVSYERSSWGVSWGALSADTQSLYPAGQVAISFQLSSMHGSVAAQSWRLTEAALFDPTVEGADVGDVNAYRLPDRERNRGLQIVEAMRALYARLPSMLDHSVALMTAATPAKKAMPDQFVIVRHLEDYDFVEKAIVDVKTGLVRAAGIVPRREPIVGRPGEWVLSPYQPSYLPPAVYRELVALLATKFEVRFEDNLTAARFRGIKPAVSYSAASSVQR